MNSHNHTVSATGSATILVYTQDKSLAFAGRNYEGKQRKNQHTIANKRTKTGRSISGARQIQKSYRSFEKCVRRISEKNVGGQFIEVYTKIEKKEMWLVNNNTFEYEKLVSCTSFTTEKKPKTRINIQQKRSTVYEKCVQLTQIADGLSENHMMTERDVVDLVELYIGADKETIRAYTGYHGYMSGGSYGNTHIVGLSRKGYLEKFGLMHLNRGIWHINYQMLLPVTPTRNQTPTLKMGNQTLIHMKG